MNNVSDLKWRQGKSRSEVVSETPSPDQLNGADDLEHYNGYLVAESVPPSLVPLIAAAPKMASLLLRSLTHVTHGAPTAREVREVLEEAGVL